MAEWSKAPASSRVLIIRLGKNLNPNDLISQGKVSVLFISAVYTLPSNDESEDAKLAQVARRLEETARYFKRLGNLGFWGQLVCTIVSAVGLPSLFLDCCYGEDYFTTYVLCNCWCDDSEDAKLAQVTRRLQETARYFKRLGSLGFWGQLVCTIVFVSAVALPSLIVVTGKITSPATFYATAGGIAAAFISVFWSYGYIRLSDKLQETANRPSKAPPRSDVVQSLKNSIVVNLLGMGAAILGMQATEVWSMAKSLTTSRNLFTKLEKWHCCEPFGNGAAILGMQAIVGWLMAKSLTTSSNPFYQGISPRSSPFLALDVFLVQASANTILSHFLGLVCSLELLRTVTLPPSKTILIARVA
ncbi:hypothetical protein POM88_043407 [Heracleum sosnowskyi]|uniref:Uncharacterized protein n=1 Tax=Heracleum sosnowskyi TaxID=360622 RepID=A0AAD8H3B1_9APIA|nr:hypothetical protein POM88_043407 [Heracleum sosnowskyi]